MEITSIQKNIHTSPRKLQLVADLVRNMKPEKALLTLQFTKKAAAGELSKAIKTVLANAKMQNLDTLGLSFKTLEINQGVVMKRSRIKARSRVAPYKRRTSQIRIILTDQVSPEKKAVKSKVETTKPAKEVKPTKELKVKKTRTKEVAAK